MSNAAKTETNVTNCARLFNAARRDIWHRNPRRQARLWLRAIAMRSELVEAALASGVDTMAAHEQVANDVHAEAVRLGWCA